tara:strand:- start:2597 stop:2800 length:204 start_codon:yes stop_codon:yes gene_type:complete
MLTAIASGDFTKSKRVDVTFESWLILFPLFFLNGNDPKPLFLLRYFCPIWRIGAHGSRTAWKSYPQT